MLSKEICDTILMDFDSLVKEMVAADLQIARRDALIAREGFRTFRYRE